MQQDAGDGAPADTGASVGEPTVPIPGRGRHHADRVDGAGIDRHETEPAHAPQRRGLPTVDGRLGRYVVLDSLGEGGMGVVLSAFDPALQRPIALKLVRPTTRDPKEAARKQAYLRREAQALAALNHPNVVAIYDVGEYPIAGSPPGLYIAMELEKGQTLREWLAREPAHRAILDVFSQAGEGLAAAHAAGIVHGDFKPANVLRRSDGRVVVLDFGLARARGPTDPVASSQDAPLRSGSAWLPVDEATFAEDGFVMGTPAYMAPEQYEGNHGKAADQFAFCVALYSALFGRHPFAPHGEVACDRESLVHRIRDGAKVELPRTRAGLGRVGRVVLRGLSHAPEQRWPDMTALLRAMARARGRRAVAVAVVALAGLGIAALAFGLDGDDEPAHRSACVEFPELTAVWDEPQRVALRDAARRLAAASQGDDDTWIGDSQRVMEREFHRFADQWRHERRGVCEAPRGKSEGHDANVRLQQACLDANLTEMSTFLQLLGDASIDTWVALGESTSALTPPHACREIAVGRQGVADTLPDGGAQVRRLLSSGRARLHAGQFEAAHADAQQAANLAREAGAAELLARAEWLLGDVLEGSGDYTAAVEQLSRVAWSCSLLSCDAVALQAMAEIVKILAADLGDFEEAQRWEVRARELMASMDDVDAFLESTLFNSVGLLELYKADYAEAEAAFRYAAKRNQSLVGHELRLAAIYNNLGNALEAMARSPEAAAVLSDAARLRETALGENHPSLASVLSNLGIVLLAMDDVEGARVRLSRAVEITEGAFGPDHPALAHYYNNLANVHYELGDLPAARASYQRTIDVFESTVGHSHANLALAMSNLGLVQDQPGDALALHQRGLAILERSVPAQHPSLAMLHNNIGSALRDLGRYDEARAAYLRALEIRERALGLDHPFVGTTVDNLGSTARLSGNPEAAVPWHERSLEIWLKAYGTEHRKIATARTGLAEALLAAYPEDGEQVLRARTEASQAFELLERGASGDPVDKALAALALARALSMAPDSDRTRALQLAQRARSTVAARADATRELAQLDAFLATL